MFKHILVPVDGSPASLAAVRQATSLARAFDSQVTALYVIDPYPFVGVGADFAYGQGEYLVAAKASAAEALKAAREAATGQALTERIIEGPTVYDGILQAAQENGVDLLVMGSHGRSGLERLLIGSTTRRVLSHTSLPVFVVRG
jgi:nucleotide-binding universal stress UspA family protein